MNAQPTSLNVWRADNGLPALGMMRAVEVDYDEANVVDVSATLRSLRPVVDNADRIGEFAVSSVDVVSEVA
jgi:hypothetical protein